MFQNWIVATLAIFAASSLQTNSCDGAKILGFFAAPGKSHLIIHTSLMNALAKRDHEITTISTLPLPGEVENNIRSIIIPVDVQQFDEQLKVMTKNAETKGFEWIRLFLFLKNLTTLYEDMLVHPEFLNIKNEQFDLVIIGWFMNDFHIGIASHFHAPAIISVTVKPNPTFRKLVGMSNEPSHIPSMFLSYNKGSMTFCQRVTNFFAVTIESLITHALDYFWVEPNYTKNFPPDKYPSFDDAKKNISLVLVNHHFSQGSMEAYLPGMVEVGGMHIESKPKPLPKDIKDWLDGATDGAILFTLGSTAKSTYLSPGKRDVIIRTLGKLKQRVLWKWEDDTMENKPDNVMISKWLPQNDILAHPNTKLFISHCGMGSINEAKFHGIPILGTPIVNDQPANMAKIVNDGWAIGCPLKELNDETFMSALNEILTNQTYTNRAKTISNLYRDRPQHPIDTAVYWVEYVIRHKGAKHMQSPAIHLNFFQYHSLDVIGFILVSVYVAWKIAKFTLCAIYQKCCKSKAKSKKE